MEKLKLGQNVLEPLYGHLLLSARMDKESAEYSDAWNFGPDDENIVKNGVIKPLEALDLPEDKEIVVYISEEKEEKEYSEWTDEEWQMMKHQEETGFAKKVLGGTI